MVLIVTALMIEARPIIDHFKLKKDLSSHAFEVYKNTYIILIVSGLGKVKSAMAVVYLISVYSISGNNVIINIGFCGAGNNKHEIGSLLYINKISDMDMGKDYYPDVFAGIKIPEEAIRCYSRVIKREDFDGQEDFYCDMESSGFIVAANKFFYAHQIAVLKVISDFLMPQKLDKMELQGFIRDNLTKIDQVIHELSKLNETSNEFSLEEEKELLDVISSNLRFTGAMKQLLFKEIYKSRQKGMEPVKILKNFVGATVNSKLEGKKVFEEILQKLNKRQKHV
ncbi:MAG: nucleoside phosphorylase [Bacillota bacterium]|nr:nucleoside phosphorylase [Bacillota bacterium]